MLDASQSSGFAVVMLVKMRTFIPSRKISLGLRAALSVPSKHDSPRRKADPSRAIRFSLGIVVNELSNPHGLPCSYSSSVVMSNRRASPARQSRYPKTTRSITSRRGNSSTGGSTIRPFVSEPISVCVLPPRISSRASRVEHYLFSSLVYGVLRTNFEFPGAALTVVRYPPR